MSNRLPIINSQIKVSIICEGAEEYDYMTALANLGIWSDIYKFDFDDAGGNGNIPARYQDKYQNRISDIVLVFCDTDKKPYEQYEGIKNKINEFHGTDNAAEAVIIFGNPCTMQIIIEHWQEVNLQSPSKCSNASIIQACTGIENYKAHHDQRQTLMNKITPENYADMKSRISRMSSTDTEKNSTNFGRFLSHFESNSAKWIDDINNSLEVLTEAVTT